MYKLCLFNMFSNITNISQKWFKKHSLPRYITTFTVWEHHKLHLQETKKLNPFLQEKKSVVDRIIFTKIYLLEINDQSP